MFQMRTLREVIIDAKERKVAVGHFNFSTLDGAHAIARAARILGLPVILGVSEGERDFVGVRSAVAITSAIRAEFNQEIYLNADHTYSVARVREAIDAGFDMAIFDGAKLSLDENISSAKESVKYAKKCGREVLVEGELGYIGQSSKVFDEIPEGAAIGDDQMTTPEEAVRFVAESGVDLFSPAIGSIHGMLRSHKNPNLHIDSLSAISAVLKIPLVLHGASGLADQNVRDAISAGISLVHVNTELRVAWQSALKIALQENPEEVAPYKILKASSIAMEKVVENKLKLFNNL